MREILQDVLPSREYIDLHTPPLPHVLEQRSVSEKLANEVEMKYQQGEFARHMNKSILAELIRACPRGQGLPLDEYEMRLIPLRKSHSGGYVTNEKYFGRIWVDGTHGFALGCTPPESQYPQLVAGASFLGRDDLPGYLAKDPVKEIPSDFPDGLVIVQIQGPSTSIMYDNRESIYTRSVPVVQNVEYQKVLVAAIAGFAHSIGITDIGILAASRNRNRTLPSSRAGFSASVDQLRPHYDLTAKNLGFTMQKDGIHRLHLG